MRDLQSLYCREPEPRACVHQGDVQLRHFIQQYCYQESYEKRTCTSTCDRRRVWQLLEGVCEQKGLSLFSSQCLLAHSEQLLSPVLKWIFSGRYLIGPCNLLICFVPNTLVVFIWSGIWTLSSPVFNNRDLDIWLFRPKIGLLHCMSRWTLDTSLLAV